MGKKIFLSVLIMAGVIAAYFVILATQQVQVDMTNQAVASINTTSPGQFGDAKAFLTYWPFAILVLPAGLGIFWIVGVLREK